MLVSEPTRPLTLLVLAAYGRGKCSTDLRPTDRYRQTVNFTAARRSERIVQNEPSVVNPGAIEYCHNQDFTAECPSGTLILMTSALYGRMAIGPCVKTDFGFVGCYTDVLAHVHERCSGRSSCSIRVPDATLDMTRPCNEDLKSYLEVTYSCVKVATPSDASSCTLLASTSDTVGYLSNRVQFPASVGGETTSSGGSVGGPQVKTKRCGTESDPWVVSVLPGQRINVSLLDFTALPSDLTASRRLSDRKNRSSTSTPPASPPPSTLSPTTSSKTTVAPVTNVGCDRYATLMEFVTTASTSGSAQSQMATPGGGQTSSREQQQVVAGSDSGAASVYGANSATETILEVCGGVRSNGSRSWYVSRLSLQPSTTSHRHQLQQQQSTRKAWSVGSGGDWSQSPQQEDQQQLPPPGYTTTGNSVKIIFHHALTSSGIGQEFGVGGGVDGSSSDTSASDYNFLIKYEAVGCPDIRTPSNVWLKRDTTNQMIAGCMTSEITWTLDCVGTQWLGTSFNCSVGQSLLIILIVSLAIGLLVLLLGVVYFKRRRNHSSNALSQQSRHLRDLKPLNAPSDDSAYDCTPTGVYARNAAFEPPSRQPLTGRRPGGTHGRGVNAASAKLTADTTTTDVDDDNEYEYVWDAGAGGTAAELQCAVPVAGGGRRRDMHHGHSMAATFRRADSGADRPAAKIAESIFSTSPQPVMRTADHVAIGGVANTGGVRHQCSCMTGGITASSGMDHVMRTMPPGVSRSGGHNKSPMPATATMSGGSCETAGVGSGASHRHPTSAGATTLGRFSHLENRSRTSGPTTISSSSKAAGLPTARAIDESATLAMTSRNSSRACPHCGHHTVSGVTSSNGGRSGPESDNFAVCSAGTPLTRVRHNRPDAATVDVLPHRMPPSTASGTTHRRM